MSPLESPKSDESAVNGKDRAASAERDAAIEAFAEKFLVGENQDLYQQMLLTVCRLARDQADRGDVKLLNKALAETRYALKVFAPFHETRKVSIFGSSRTPEDHADYLAALEFAKRMCAHGWMVITGAGDGIMKAGHGGAGREASFGVAIRLPFEQRTNDIIADDPKLVNFRYFFTRKLMFMKEAAAVALFPGGFGTQDEGFEALVLIQTGKAPIVPVVMVEQDGGQYWQRWVEYVRSDLLDTHMISPEDMGLFHVAESIDDAVNEVLTFYRVYHSMRYVGDDLVLRLNERLSENTVAELNRQFGAILAGGVIEQVDPLDEEHGEYPDKPRLRFAFNKKSFGRLRQLINAVNQA